MDTIAKVKLLQSFYIPTKVINKSIRKAVNSCTNCNILNPKSQKRFLGLKRSLNEHLAAGKNIYVDITYVKVLNVTFYLFLLVDQASSYLICKLFKEISVKSVTEFLLTLFGIITLNDCIISDSGAENSKTLSESLLSLGIRHKRIAPHASNQNSAESNINVFRHSLKRLISNSLQNNLKLDYMTLSKLCIITCSLINETAPFNSFLRGKNYLMVCFIIIKDIICPGIYQKLVY